MNNYSVREVAPTGPRALEVQSSSDAYELLLFCCGYCTLGMPTVSPPARPSGTQRQELANPWGTLQSLLNVG
eukprot:4984150-Amphidinium_carterae.1